MIGAGSWGTAMAVLLAKGGLEVELGTRSEEKAAQILRKGENADYLPGVKLPHGVAVKRSSEIELAGCDLICLAVPSKALPNVVGGLADRIGSRASVLLLSKGFVQPMGALPNEYVSQRVRARAIASLGGPAHAQEAAAGMAALVLGSADADLRTMLGEVFERAGLVCERTDDVAESRWRGRPRTPRRSPPRPPSASGSMRPGSPRPAFGVSASSSRCSSGARLETFSGLAGVGDLTATVMAPKSRNRQAGELLGAGVAAEKIEARVGQASEGLDSVPLIAHAVSAAGVEAPGLEGLASLIEGEIDADEWVAGLRRAERAREAA